jgi:hypothetical protein
MTATKTETWLDVMPAIQLARSVPVKPSPLTYGLLRRDVGRVQARLLREHGAVVERMHEDRCRLRATSLAPKVEDGLEEANDWRVDLSDELGFLYACRWLVTQGQDGQRGQMALARVTGACVGRPQQANSLAHLMVSWLTKRHTDADRLALAHALREMVS